MDTSKFEEVERLHYDTATDWHQWDPEQSISVSVFQLDDLYVIVDEFNGTFTSTNNEDVERYINEWRQQYVDNFFIGKYPNGKQVKAYEDHQVSTDWDDKSSPEFEYTIIKDNDDE